MTALQDSVPSGRPKSQSQVREIAAIGLAIFLVIALFVALRVWHEQEQNFFVPVVVAGTAEEIDAQVAKIDELADTRAKAFKGQIHGKMAVATLLAISLLYLISVGTNDAKYTINIVRVAMIASAVAFMWQW